MRSLNPDDYDQSLSRHPWISLKHSRRLAHGKASSYWKSKIRFASINSHRIWQHINSLLVEKRSKTKSSFTAYQYHIVMDKKTANIDAATASTNDAMYIANNTPKWSQLEKVSIDDVLRYQLLTCEAVWLGLLLNMVAQKVGSYSGSLHHYHVKCASLKFGRFPSSRKHTIVTPLLKR